MKGIRLKKFNELKIRLKDRKSTGMSKQRQQKEKEDNSREKVRKKEREARVKNIFLIHERLLRGTNNYLSSNKEFQILVEIWQPLKKEEKATIVKRGQKPLQKMKD